MEELKKLSIEALKEKYPTFPEKYLPVTKYTDKTANGLTKCIIDYIIFKGGFAERISNTGRYVQGETYTDVLDRTRVLPGKYIKGSGTNGTADISAIFKGINLRIEVKIGKDRQSEDQKKYQESIERSGGIYMIAKDFKGFKEEFNQVITNNQPAQKVLF